MPARPSAENLLRTAGEYLADLRSRAEPRDQFPLRVAMHLLQIVERELRIGGEIAASQSAALSEMLDRDGSLDDLNREACRRIRFGDFDDSWEEALALVRELVDNDLRIVAPTKRLAR
jgi:hypothetical protein